MKVTTLVSTGSNQVSFGCNSYNLGNKAEVRQLVADINSNDTYCGIVHPMAGLSVSSEGKSLLEVLLSNKVDTNKLIATELDYNFYTLDGSRGKVGVSESADENNTGRVENQSTVYTISQYEEKSLKFIIVVLIGWLKTVSKNYKKQFEFRQEFRDTFKNMQGRQMQKIINRTESNGFRASINTSPDFWISVDCAEWEMLCKEAVVNRLDPRKYYTISIYMPLSAIRYYTKETYGETLARYTDQEDQLKTLGEREFVKKIRESCRLDAQRKFDADIKDIKSFEEYNNSIIDFINSLVDNKNIFLINNKGYIKIAFNNNMTVIDALRKIVSAQKVLGKHMIKSLGIGNEENVSRPWDWTCNHTCMMDELLNGIDNLESSLLERVSKKSSTAETDLISIFKAIKALDK